MKGTEIGGSIAGIDPGAPLAEEGTAEQVRSFSGWDLFWCSVIGLVITGLIIWITEYYTGTGTGPVKSIADLRGGKVGFSVAGVEEALLTTILERNGVGLDEIDLVNVNWSLSPSLMSGQVDAVIGAFRNFELNQMDIEGVKGRCFYLEEEGLPAYDELIYIANRESMNKDVIRRFLQATELATQYIINHPQESWDIFKSTAKELDDELNKRAWVDTLPRLALRPAALDTGRYARFEAFLKDAGLLKDTREVAQFAIDVGADD